MSIDIQLKKADKVLREGENVKGAIVVESRGELSHNGIHLFMDGFVRVRADPNAKSSSSLPANFQQTTQVVAYNLEVSRMGKLPSGHTEIPFELPLKARAEHALYDTYRGVYVNIEYSVRAELRRTMLAKDLVKGTYFSVEKKTEGESKAKPVEFTISPDKLENVEDKSAVPNFKLSGHIDSVVCHIDAPFSGWIVVERTEVEIKSIELQLVRVETVGTDDASGKEATEIQNIQIAEGNPVTEMRIPLYMIFPRNFTCPTVIGTNFKVEFEINIVTVFRNGYLVTENFPIKLVRPDWLPSISV